MPLDTLSELSTLLVAVSLATERLVVIVKTLFPKLGAKISAPGGDEDLLDRNRRLLVLGVAYASALLTTWTPMVPYFKARPGTPEMPGWRDWMA